MGHDEELFMCDDYNAYRHRTRVPGWYPHVDNGEDADDAASSILTFSTTATTDNIPGAGRSVDTFFYQPVGKWIERFAMRISISSLHPTQISRYIEAQLLYHDYGPLFVRSQLNPHEVIARTGPTFVAGLKSLVKQTQ